MRAKWLILLLLLFSLRGKAYASWSGPQEVVNATWGSGAGQFYFATGGTFDLFPKNIAVDKDGVVLISDENNKRVVLYNKDGSLRKIITPPSELPAEDSIYGWPSSLGFVLYQGGNSLVIPCEYKKIPDGIQPLKMCFLDYNGRVLAKTDIAQFFPFESGFVSLKNNNYTFYSPTGQIIKTYAERPAELGFVSEESLGNKRYKVVVKYPDKTWLYMGKGRMPQYLRDKDENLYGYGEKQAVRFNSCGKELDRLTIPKSQIETISRGPQVEPKIIVKEEYGPPVIAPNGDVYTWKRTPDTYSILKWIWVDDKKTLHDGAPSEPEHLSAKASSTGIQLTWKDAQGRECITGYEINRSTSWNGPYTAIATVNSDARKYEDVSANAGTTYFYKVRAISGNEYSEYTSVVSTKR